MRRSARLRRVASMADRRSRAPPLSPAVAFTDDPGPSPRSATRPVILSRLDRVHRVTPASRLFDSGSHVGGDSASSAGDSPRRTMRDAGRESPAVLRWGVAYAGPASLSQGCRVRSGRRQRRTRPRAPVGGVKPRRPVDQPAGVRVPVGIVETVRPDCGPILRAMPSPGALDLRPRRRFPCSVRQRNGTAAQLCAAHVAATANTDR